MVANDYLSASKGYYKPAVMLPHIQLVINVLNFWKSWRNKCNLFTKVIIARYYFLKVADILARLEISCAESRVKGKASRLHPLQPVEIYRRGGDKTHKLVSGEKVAGTGLSSQEVHMKGKPFTLEYCNDVEEIQKSHQDSSQNESDI